MARLQEMLYKMDETSHTSYVPEFDAMALLQQRLAQKKVDHASVSDTPKGPFDPHQLMVNRKKINAGEMIADTPVQTWPEEDVKKLEDFCKKMGIVGFSAGLMHPLAALAKLKQHLGVVDDTPRTEGFGPNYPYTEAMNKRQLLHG